MTGRLRAAFREPYRRLRDISRRRALQLVALAIAFALFYVTFSSPQEPYYTPSDEPPPKPLVEPTSPPILRGPNDLSLSEIRDVVSRTPRGFYARDYSLNLGWNNMKYILEAAILQGSLLNRTTVLPSFVYARACELPVEACAAFLPMVNRGDALQSDEWRKLPPNEQLAWKVPLGLMIDLPRLRRRRNVLLVSEYLHYHGLPPSLEASTGRWDQDAYHGGPHQPSLFVLERNNFDPNGLILLDNYPDTGRNPKPRSDMSTKLLEVSKQTDGHIVEWVDVKRLLGGSKTDEELETELRENDWVATHTFHSILHQELFKVPVYPRRQAAPHHAVRGWIQYYGEVTEDVFLLKGETHLYRKAGGMRFTTEAVRDDFARLALHDMAYTEQVRELAEVLDGRMRQRVGDRQFMSTHMRRGDFERLNWSLQATIPLHLGALKKRFIEGRRYLQTVHNRKLTTYDVPDVVQDTSVLLREPPQADDPFFLMTDERSPGALDYVRSQGAVLVQDLLTPEDRQRLGWPVIFTDVLSLVEQTLAARSDYFVGHAFSSVASGVVGIRAARGMVPHTDFLIGM